MKVKWTEILEVPDWVADGEIISNNYEGEVIGTNKSFFGNVTLVVATNKDEIREVSIKDVKII